MKVVQMKKVVLNGIMVASLVAAGLLHAQNTHTLQPGVSPSLEEAVATAVSGDTIELETGVYTLTDNLTVDKKLTIQGTAGTTREDVIIDGDGKYNIRLTANNTEVWGVTIQNGASSDLNGGGISLTGTNTLLANCVVTNCKKVASANNAPGGVYVSAPGATVSNCVITANKSATYGGGIRIEEGILVDSLVEGNTAESESGGGVWMDRNSIVDRCVIRGNKAQQGAGGVWQRSGILRNSLVIGNQASGITPGSNGGGGIHMVTYTQATGRTLENCTIVGNHAVGVGGGLRITEATVLRNLIVAGNTSANANVLVRDVYRANTGFAVTHSYIGSGLDNYTNTSGILTLAADGTPGFKDDTDPNPLLNDYRLNKKTSPCIGTGLYQPWMDTAFALDGTPRLFKGEVDMGAYQNHKLLILPTLILVK